MSSHCTLLIVGAGAAGIGAGHAARRLGLDFRIIEASHRVGGRGLTEEIAPGVPWDLGCHWLHSGSINALAPVADSLGFHYDTDLPSRRFYLNGAWLSPEQTAAYDRYAADIWHRVETQYKTGQDRALMDSIDLDSVWAPYYTYWQSLMTSHDVDSFSALDLIRYNDTDENWPVREGLGALLTRHAEGLPIALNTAVHAIDWGGEGVSITTNRGTLTADKVIITVSTGVLAAQDIAFAPALPSATQEAIGNLPLGCYNNFAMLYEAAWPFDSDTPDRVDYSNGDDINFAFKLRCSGWPYIYCAVAGRHADWLEKQPQGESESLMMSALTDLFGSDFKRRITRFRTSAWGQDPLVRGAYSASRPGCGDQRTALAEPIADRLYFAGEAASRSAFCTAHGAWETGRDAVIRSSGPLSPQ